MDLKLLILLLKVVIALLELALHSYRKLMDDSNLQAPEVEGEWQ